MSGPLCAATWPLLAPNAEDRANGTTHRCGRPEGHQGPCRCACGHHPNDDAFELALERALTTTDTEETT